MATKHIERVSMEGFGKYLERTVGPFKTGLNVVYGPNETGKSTTMECTRQVLYGWIQSNKASLRNDYVPRNKTTRAGSITMVADDGSGQWTLSRSGSKTEVRTLGGSPWDDAFEELTRDVSKETYNSVFSFSADDLQRMERSNDDMTSQLLTAGSGTANVPLEVLSQIDSDITDLCSPRKNSPNTIRNMRAHHNTLTEKIAMLSDEAAQLEDAQDELIHLDSHITDLTDERDAWEDKLAVARDTERELKRAQADLVGCQTEIAENQQRYLNGEAALVKRGLTPEEKAILSTADEREAVFGNLSQLQSAYDRSEDRRSEMEKLRLALSQSTPTGCETGFNIQQAIAERQDKRSTLEGALTNAQQMLRDAEAHQAGLDARDEVAAEKPKRSKLDIVLIAIGIVGILAAGTAVTLGALWNMPLLVGSGAAIAALSIVLIVVGFRHGRPSAANVSDVNTRRQIMAESLAAAQHHVISAQRDLDDFNVETKAYLDEHGFAAAQGNLSYAQKMRESEEAIEEQKRVLATKDEAYAESLKDLEAVVSQVKSRFPGDETVRSLSAPELIGWLPAMHGALIDSQTKNREYQSQVGEVERIKLERDRIVEKAEGFQSDIERILNKAGLEDVRDASSVLVSRQQEAQAAIERVDASLKDAHTRKGELQNSLAEGLKDEQLTDLRLERDALETRRELAAKRLVELVVARNILERSIANWEQEKQPEVYRRASELFSDMTCGVWSRVDFDGNEIIVISANSESQTPEKLSCGTRQQLYLALRVALLFLASDVGRDLPVMADDILVNFDESRREGAARALIRLAEQRQVILFTCHRSTRDLLKSTAPHANLIELGV